MIVKRRLLIVFQHVPFVTDIAQFTFTGFRYGTVSVVKEPKTKADSSFAFSWAIIIAQPLSRLRFSFALGFAFMLFPFEMVWGCLVDAKHRLVAKPFSSYSFFALAIVFQFG